MSEEINNTQDSVSRFFYTANDAKLYWNQLFEEGCLSDEHFRNVWKQMVPKLLMPTSTMDYQAPQAHLSEEIIQSMLIEPLEYFLCNGDSQETLEKLSQNNDSPTQCGRLLRMGDPTYSCKDCAHDNMCVLCVFCFKNSEHRFHRYKMSTAYGGGYCDCGDPEAWSGNIYCSNHTPDKDREKTHQLSSNSLSESLQNRASILFSCVLNYIRSMLLTDTLLSLPSDLSFTDPRDESDDEFYGGIKDNYSTIIYNDEIHTFHEVITTLPRAVGCDRETAVRLAILIDREGRCLVKCDGIQICSKVKVITEKIMSREGGRPLKVVVMHSSLVAHQSFALRLLLWLQKILNINVGFRRLFSLAMLKNIDRKVSLLEDIIRNDTMLWKTARHYLHNLFMGGMLLENETKIDFARVFTKCYGHTMKNFIVDDHDHSFSIASLAVQLFTVPSIATILIVSEDALAILFRTFMSEIERKRNSRGKLEFQRNLNTPSYRRSIVILHDVKHLLSSSGKEWTDPLRKSFLHGLSLLLEICSWMQGMDPQKRQLRDHLEYELEWESGFHLHTKLSPILSLVLDWILSDRLVFIKAVRMIFKKLHETSDQTHNLLDIDSSYSVIPYNIGLQSVSVHLPLSRLLAGLLTRMSLFDLNYYSNEFNIPEKPSPLFLIEPSLRMFVFVSQVQAGLWRRNGHSVADQIRAYHDPQCAREMLDKDVSLLQFGATLLDPEHFMVNLIYKFQLDPWVISNTSSSSDESLQQSTTTALVEEFFRTLIILCSERYTIGVGNVSEEKALTREIIQYLCVEPMTHSALNKFHHDNSDSVEKILNTVAVFKSNSSSEKGGFYELKSEFYSHYDVFFYHYSRAEQSKSEETQRLRRKAAKCTPICSPPPPPPSLTSQFQPLSRIMMTESFINLLSLVLERTHDLKSRYFSENQIHRVLHLIGVSLYEHSKAFTNQASKLLPLLEQIVGSQRIESHNELLLWTISHWKNVGGISDESINKSLFLPSTFSEEESERNYKRSELAKARRQKLLDQMKNAQNNFLRTNATLFGEEVSSPSTCDSKSSVLEKMEIEMETDLVVCLGSKKSPSLNTQNSFTCIVCQEDVLLSSKDTSASLVMAAFIQKSTVLAISPKSEYEFPLEDLHLLSSNLSSALHTTSCGHIMHGLCWQKYYDDVLQIEGNRSRLRRTQSFNVEKDEFLCPLCRSLSNSVIPLYPPFEFIPLTPLSSTPLSFSSWLQILLSLSKLKEEGKNDLVSELTQEPLLNDSENIKSFIRLFSECETSLSPSNEILEMSNAFLQAVYRVGLQVLPDHLDNRIPLLVWKSIAYTIHSEVWKLFEMNQGLFSFTSSSSSFSSSRRDCLLFLVRFSGLVSSHLTSRDVIKSHCFELLSLLWSQCSERLCSVSFLDFDAFGLLVPLTFSLPSLFAEHQLPSSNSQDIFILHLVFGVHILQILYRTKRLVVNETLSVGLFAKLFKNLGEIKRESLHFLRCSALFYHHLSSVPSPPSLQKLISDPEVEYDLIVHYLGLPKDPLQVLESIPFIQDLMKHPNLTKSLQTHSFSYPLVMKSLIELPLEYFELINSVSAFTCPKSAFDESRVPAMCLICGALLCSQSYCCQITLEDETQVGACTAHAEKCSAGNGIFLRVRECKVVLLSGRNKGCFISPPYVDKYGETDIGLQRGNPLNLCQKRYRKINRLWLTHGIPEEISRNIEANQFLITTPWQHL